MAAEQYCLKWTNYQRNVTSSFKTLLENEEFVDVTISAEGKSCSAHRVVLSAASPYFRNLLSSLKAWQHPVLVLRDISHIDVTAILEFVYDGKVDVSQDRLQSFLRTAQFLQISGLVEENGSSREEQQAKEKVCSSSGGGGKRKLISGEVGVRKLARKEGVEGSKSEEEGVTLKSEPVDIGPAEYPSFPAREPEVSRKSPGPRLQSSSPERPDDEGAAGGSGGGGGGAGSEIEGSVTCLVCRATLSNCNALYYHMNYVHSGAVEPMDIIRKMVTSEGLVKQEHLE